MGNVRNHGNRTYSGLAAVVTLLICSLTLSLATRFCFQVTSQVHTGKSIERRSVEPKRQHCNRDASRWATSVTPSTFLRQVTLYAPMEPAEIPLPNHAFDKSLYNRPPPFGV